MARKYSAPGLAVLGTNVTAVNVIGSVTHLFYLYDITLGCGSTPADQALIWEVEQTTIDGTGTPLVPQPIQGGGIASVATAKITYTAEPTYSGVSLLDIGLHQRSTYRWVARPGSEFISNPAAGDGIAAKVAVTSGTPTCRASFLFEE